MTKPRPETLEAERHKLYVTDAELIRILGVPKKIGKAVLHVLTKEKKHGFPPPLQSFGGRRYLPAVKAFFDRTGGITILPSQGRKDHG